MKVNEKNLIAYSQNREHIDKEGYLLKREEVNKAFQRRWFVLKGNLLFYFDKKGDKEPIGVIILEGCTTELAENEEYLVFKLIFHSNPTRVYELSAETQVELESWMKFISRASYDYLKLMVIELQKQLEEADEASKRTDAEIAPALLSTKDELSKRQKPSRINPFDIEQDTSFSDLWRSSESLQNASSLLSRSSHLTHSVKASQPRSVPFRPAPPPPSSNKPRVSPKRKCFAELHKEYGKRILEDRERHKKVGSEDVPANLEGGGKELTQSYTLIEL